MPRKHVEQASLDGLRRAIPRHVSDSFIWESTAAGAAVLFIGTGQAGGSALRQDTWFEFDEGALTAKYAIRLVEMDEESESAEYGSSRAELEAAVTMEEAADLLDMCIEQAVAAGARQSADQALQAHMDRDD